MAMRRPNPNSPGSFSESAFFNDDNDSEFFAMSKFESFMDRKSRQAKQSRAVPSRSGAGDHNPNNVISPRSDDGMSFVSRKKHDNYANVVMEMKRKQNGQHKMHQHVNSESQRQVYGQQAGFQQNQMQQRGYSQQQQMDQGWGNEADWSDFGSSNHFNQPQQQPVQHRRPQPQQMHQQSRMQQQQQQQQQRYTLNDPPSKPAQRTGRKLYRESNSNSSSSENINSSQLQSQQRSRSTVRRTADLQRKLAQTYITQRCDDEVSEAGSVVSSVFLGNKGSGSWGDSFSSTSFHHSGSYGSGVGSVSDGGPKKKKGLDALLNNKRFTASVASSNDDSSVVSGTGSVAARRRAKAALKNSPQRPSHLGHVDEDSVSKSCAPLQPPPSNSARRNMRMRMQNKPTSGFKKDLSAFQLDSAIDDEINSALNELKLDHPEMDFSFDRMGSGHSHGGSVDSSASGRLSGGQQMESPPKVFKKEPARAGRHSPVTVGSQKTLTTKSMTVESSDSQNVMASQRGNNNVVRSNVISVEQYESVERCSESSSLTDTSDWHVGSGHGGSTGGMNMFKDANKGSTFHKSKRIVRVGESISENNEAKHPAKEEVISESSVMPSIKDRISQFKSSGAAPTHHSITSPSSNKIYNSPGSSIKEEPSREKSSVYSSSSSNTIPTSTRSRSGLPPQAPTSSPFQVKLRKTKNEDLGNSAVEETVSPSNQFLSNVKLRSTGTPSWKERQQAKQEAMEAEQCDMDMNDSTDHRQIEEPASPQTAPTRKLTYREQQDLLKQQQQEKRDVATLIRERIAMSKQSNSIPPSPKSNAGSELDIGSLRGNLKKTSYGTKEAATPTSNSGPSFSSRPISPQHVSTPSRSPVHTPKETPESNPKQALNAMLAGRLGSPPMHDEKKVESPSDSRGALMAAINNRVEKEDESPPDPRAALMASISKRAEKADPPTADPRAALMAAISKRASCPQVDAEEADPKANLAAMLQNRIVASGGGDNTPSKSEAKNNLSAMLAQRTPPTNESAEANASSDGRPALKNDPKFEKYFKMLKVGMPLPAVQHAMTRDGLDPSVMEGDHNKPAPEPKPEGLPLKDDPAFAKYFKMLKLGLPMGAVKNAMERDGLDSSVMDGNHNLPVSELTSNSPATKKKQKDTHRRTRLHWDTLVGKVKSNTVWALVNKDEELDNIVIDETEFTNLFQAEIKSSSAPVEKSASSARNVVQVIDPKRANNGGIILARLRMSYDDMAKAVEQIDETAMTANQAQGIVEYMPTLDERQKLRDYMKAGDGDSASKFDKLCECEKFMVAMMTVKQSKRKLRALLFKLQFRGCIHDLARDVFSIEKACDELSASVRLRKLFGIVLNIGNRLNTAGPGEKRKAGAFSIRSLLKLNQAKAFDNKTTFLHYVVLVVQRNSESLLDFKEDLPTALKADKIYWDQCVNELEEVETQLENVRKLALHEAKASKVIYSLPSKNKQQEDNDSDDLSVASISLEEEVALLRSTKVGMFALSAIKKVSQLRERVDIAKEKFCQLLEYFGEDGESSNLQPHELFEIISTFCRNFDVAREDVIKMEKAKKRDEKKNQDGGSQKDDQQKNTKQTINAPSPNLPRPPPSKKSPMLRSSSCQPNMSNVLADLRRATSKESHELKQEQYVQSAPPSTSSPSTAIEQTERPCIHSPKSNDNATKSPSDDYPSQLLNNASLAIKYPADEPITPVRTSPIQTPRGEAPREEAPVISQKSSESEAAPAHSPKTGTSTNPEQKSISPRTTAMSRRDRRERVRSRSLAQSKVNATQQTSTAVTDATPKEPTPQPEKSSPKATTSPATSQSSARAAARDRYARHKKMMHQRKAAS